MKEDCLSPVLQDLMEEVQSSNRRSLFGEALVGRALSLNHYISLNRKMEGGAMMEAPPSIMI